MKRKLMEIQNPEHDGEEGPETTSVLTRTNGDVCVDSSNSPSRLIDPSDDSTPSTVLINNHSSNADGVKRSVNNIQLGQEYDILDSSKRWCEGQVGSI